MATDQSWDEPPTSKRCRVEDKSTQQPQLDDMLNVIPHPLLDKQCSVKFLCRVAKHLTQWQLLRPYLELSDSDEDDIIETFPSNDLRKQRCLLRWNKKFGKNATYSVLVTAIFDMGNVDLAWRVCEMAEGEVEHTSSSTLMSTSIPHPAMPISSTISGASSLATALPTPEVAIAAPFSAMVSYRDHLRHGYRTHKPVMVMEWPPPPALKYISLAMIRKDKVGRGMIAKRDIRSAIHGNIDGMLHEKVPVEVDQLFSLDSDVRKVILIEGAPGSGKSTLLWHICQMWESEEFFQQFTLVLLVQLRDTAVHTAQCLADILPFVPSRSSKYTPSEYRKIVASDIEEGHGDGVLILLDGWDEAPANLQQEGSLIHDIIAEPSKCSVEAAAVLVSSRPSASYAIRKYVSTRVVTIGFTQERREEYVRESLQDKPETACSLLQQIESIPQLSRHCHLPLNLVIITHTFLCSNYKLPSTYCRIIITLALSCLLRHIKKSTPHGNVVELLRSFSDLPDGIREEFLKLCKLAYEGVVKKKYSFSSEDMIEVTKSSSNAMPQITTFGLLQSVHSLLATGSSTVYHFLHLSLQELCAAYYITSLPSPETQHIKALKKMVVVEKSPYEEPLHTFSTHFQSVCEFYSALTYLGNPQVVSQLLDIYRDEDDGRWDRDWSWEGPYPAIVCDGAYLTNESFFKCLAEADNADLTAKIIGTSVHIESINIGQALASAIALAPHLESFSCVDFTSTTGKALQGKDSLKRLVISIPCSIPEECIDSVPYFIPYSYSIDMACVNHVLKTCTNLEHLDMNGELGDDEVSHLAEVLNQTSIQTLCLSYSGTGEAGIKALSSAFKTNTTVQHLSLDLKKGIGKAGIIVLSSALKTNFTIRHLTVSCKDIGLHGQDILIAALSQNISLNTLELIAHDYPGPFPEDDRAFFSCLKQIPLLEFSIISSFTPHYWKHDTYSTDCLSATYVGWMLLSGNLVELADILKLNKPPAVNKQIYINLYNKVCIRVDFNSMCFLQLKLSAYNEKKCEIGCESMNQPNEKLTKTTAAELDFSNHKIDITRAAHPASFMVLEKLDISNCGIGEDGMKVLSSALSANTTLKCLKACKNNFGDKGASHLAIVFGHTPLQEIDISDCGIGEDGMVALFSALKNNTMLKYLNVHGNYFGDKGPSPLAVALSHKPLQEIDIGDCGIGEDGMIEILSALRSNTTLKCLYAHGNCFGDEGASCLATALSHMSLQEIDISYCGIGEDGMVALSLALETNTTLKHFNISGNNSRDEGIIALSSALQTNTTLTHLNISLKISGHSRLALARAILQNTSLTSLNKNNSHFHFLLLLRRTQEVLTDRHVFTCQVTKEILKYTSTSTFYGSIKRSPIVQCISIDRTTTLGEALWAGNMEEAAEVLQLNPPPTVEKTLCIHMSNNIWRVNYGSRKILEKDEGLLKIRSIYNNPTLWSSLHKLTLRKLVLGGVGACLLAEMLNETQLQKLDVRCCHIPEDGIVALSVVLSTNTTLKYLAIGGNCINECGQEALAKALTRNTTLAVLDISTCYTWYKSFKDNGEIFFKHQDEYSLTVMVFDTCYYTGEIDDIDYDKAVVVLDLKTSESSFLPTWSCFKFSDRGNEDGSSSDSTF